MNCPFHITIYKLAAAQLPRAAVPLRGARHRLPLRALRRAARPACACAASPRTTRTSSAGPTSSRPRSCACSTSSPRSCATFGFDRVRHLPLDAAGERERAPTSSGRSRRRRCKQALETRGLAVPGRSGRGRLLRPEDRHQDQGLARPRLAVLDDPGGLQQPEPLRARVHRRGRQGAPAGHGAPRAARQPRALLRRADRALRRRVPALAGAGAGGRDPGGRAAPRVRRARWRETLRPRGVRVHVDDRNEKLGYKIREAQVQKVPYMLVVGDKEVEAQNGLGAPPARGRPGLADVAGPRRAKIVSSRPSARRSKKSRARSPGGVS